MDNDTLRLRGAVHDLLQIHLDLLRAEQAVIRVARMGGADYNEWTDEQKQIYEAGVSVMRQRFAVAGVIGDLRPLLDEDDETPLPEPEPEVVAPAIVGSTGGVGEPGLIEGAPPPVAEPPVELDEPLGLIFEDDFSSGDLSKTMNGAHWGGSDRGRANAMVVPGEQSPTGKPALRLMYKAQYNEDGTVKNPSNANAQMDFHLNHKHRESWAEMDVYLLDGTEGLGARYHDRHTTRNAGHKLLRMWGYNYNKGMKYGISTSVPSRFEWGGGNSIVPGWTKQDTGMLMGPHGIEAVPFPAVGPVDDDAAGIVHRGGKTRFRVHTRPSDKGAKNGVYELWINGKLETASYTLPYGHPLHEYLDQGYLGGWHNGGVDADMPIYFTRVAFYDTDPGWSTEEPTPEEPVEEPTPNIPIDIKPTDLSPLVQVDGTTTDWGPGWRQPGTSPRWQNPEYVQVVDCHDNPVGSGKAIDYRFPAGTIMRDYRHINVCPSWLGIPGGFLCEEEEIRFIFQLSPNFQFSTAESPDRSGMKVFGYWGHDGDPSAYYVSNSGGYLSGYQPGYIPWMPAFACQPPGGQAGKGFYKAPRGTEWFLPFPYWNDLIVRHRVQSWNGAGDGLARLTINGLTPIDRNDLDQPSDLAYPRLLDGMEFGPMRGHDTIPLPETDWIRIGGLFVHGRKAS